MYYPYLVANKPAKFTEDEKRYIVQNTSYDVCDIFGALVTSPRVEYREYNPKFPYTTGTITLTFPFSHEITGRVGDMARVKASGLVLHISKRTPNYFNKNPENLELPKSCFSLKITVEGSHIEYRKRNAFGFIWPGYDPYKSGSELEDINPRKQLEKIMNYLNTVR